MPVLALQEHGSLAEAQVQAAWATRNHMRLDSGTGRECGTGCEYLSCCLSSSLSSIGVLVVLMP